MKFKQICFFLLVPVFLISSTVIAAPGPTEVLQPTLQGMVDVIADPTYSGDERRDARREKIMSIANQGFDFTEMSKLVLGKTWRKIDSQQQEYFAMIFTKLLENAYIGKLEGYAGQTVSYEDERIKGKRAGVSTIVRSSGMAPLSVNYVMINSASGWRVYDINIEGVSLLRNYREQFKSILRRDKFDGLVQIIEEKNKSFANEGTTE